MTPEQPFIFFPEGLDVRWRSFAAVAAQAEGGRRGLAEEGLPAGVVVAYRWRAGPDAVAADLAIRIGGWVALPLGPEDRPAAPEEGGEPVPAAHLLLPGEKLAEGEASRPPVRVRLPEAPEEWRALVRPRAEVRFPDPEDLVGGAVVRGERSPRPVEASEVGAAVEELHRRMTTAPAGEERPVVVACLHPGEPGGRLLLDWAVAARAALYLEGDPRLLGGSAGWARPSVVGGDGSGLAAVAAEIRRRGGAWDRPSWWRRGLPWLEPPEGLRAVVLLGGCLDGETRSLFEQYGVELVEPPAL